jgi:hypothetical protein
MRAPVLLLLAVAGTCLANAADGLSDAVAARRLLGPDVWSRIARIENAPAHGLERRTPYPPTVYALVFEMSGLLWFYCDADGTQSLSRRYGSVEADKADPGPLFRAISRRFGPWSWVDGSACAAGAAVPAPPNACFIECIAELRRRSELGKQTGLPRIVFVYEDTPTGRLGHTLLVFQSGSGLAAVDPDFSSVPIQIPAGVGTQARAISSYVIGRDVDDARELPIHGFRSAPADRQWAASQRPGGPAG